MSAWLDPLAVAVILANLLLLAVSRVRACIRMAAFQGLLVGLAPLAASRGEAGLHLVFFSLAAMGLKGLGFPWLLVRTLRKVQAKREIEPYVGYNLSVLLGIAALLLSAWLEGVLGLPGSRLSSLAVAAAFMTTLTGLLLIITRKKALTQVIGYLTAENGIFLLGTVMSPQGPLWIELSILLDLLVAVFVMGIAIHNIHSEFHSVDTDLIESLKD